MKRYQYCGNCKNYRPFGSAVGLNGLCAAGIEPFMSLGMWYADPRYCARYLARPESEWRVGADGKVLPVT